MVAPYTRFGNHVDISGINITNNNTTSSAAKNGIISFVILSIGVFSDFESVNKTRPTGGVSKPIIRFNVKNTQK